MQLNYYHDLTHKYDFLFLYQLLTVVGCIFFVFWFFFGGQIGFVFWESAAWRFFGWHIFGQHQRRERGGVGRQGRFFEDLDSEAVFCGRREVLVGEGEREIMV